MARLTFNTAAAREYFESDRLNWLRLRIERGAVTLRPAANSRGDGEVIRIERRPREIVADIDEGRFSKRLMIRLMRAGLTEDQPYFLLAPAPYGWIGIDHLPGAKPPQRQAVMVVSNFETEEAPAPVRLSAEAFDYARWMRFLRYVKADRPVEATGWEEIQEMILLAHQTTAQRQRGRQSQARIAAIRLLKAVQRRAPTLLEWEEHHPELRRQVSSLLKELGLPIEETSADIIHIHHKRRRSRHHPVEIVVEDVTVEDVVITDERAELPEITPEQVAEVIQREAEVTQPEAEPEDLPAPPRRPSRRRPRRVYEEKPTFLDDPVVPEPEVVIQPQDQVEAEPAAEEAQPVEAADESIEEIRSEADEPVEASEPEESGEPEANEPEEAGGEPEESDESDASDLEETDEPEEAVIDDPEAEANEPEKSDEPDESNEPEAKANEPDESNEPEAEANEPDVSDLEETDEPEEAVIDEPETDDGERKAAAEEHPGEGEQPEVEERHQHAETD